MEIDQAIPKFLLKSINSNKTISIPSKRKKTLINFSTTWCPLCIEEKIKLNEFYKTNIKNSDNVDFVIIFGNYKQDNINVVKKYLDMNQYNFPVYFDSDKSVIKLLNIKQVPFNILIDEDGKILETSTFFYNLKTL